MCVRMRDGMAARQHAAEIITLGCVQARIAGTRVHRFAGPAYAASKAALSTLTRELASDLGNLGIRVNAVSPGEIKTEMLSLATADEMIHDIPMHRLGDVEEVASAIYFLCCGSASYINGAEIEINGGQHV